MLLIFELGMRLVLASLGMVLDESLGARTASAVNH
jgi:hypothetical protein